MAAKGAREPITLECTECKRRNYTSIASSVENVQHIKKQNNPLRGKI